MTEKYHISPTTGNPNRCYADKRPCPLGGAEDHYSSKDEAKAAFEAKHADQIIAAGVSKGLSKQERLAALYTEHQYWGSFPEVPSQHELAIASAHAKAKRGFAPTAFRARSHDKAMELEREYDGTGSNYALVEEQDYLIATPDGGFIHVAYSTSVDAELDGSWEFYPTASGRSNYYASAEAAANAMNGEVSNQDYITLDDNEIFSGTTPSYSSWSKWEEGSVRRACNTGLKKFPSPYDSAIVSFLNHSSAKLDGQDLLTKKYLGSADPLVRRAVAARKELPREAHDRLLQDGNIQVRGALAQRPDLSQATVKALLEQKTANYDSVPPRHIVLANPVISSTVAKKVAREGDLKDLKALAKNPALPEEAKSTIKQRTESLGIKLFRA